MLHKHFLSSSTHDSILFETSPEVILFLDLRGKILAVNERVFDWIKIKPNQLVGKNIFELAILTPQSRELVKKNFQLSLSQKVVEPYEIKVIARNGQSAVGRVNGQLIKEKGRATGVLLMVTNDSRLEQEMQARLFSAIENEAKYVSFFENMASPVVICEFNQEKNDFVIKNVNRSFLKSERQVKKIVLEKSLGKVFKQKPDGEFYSLVKKAWHAEIPQIFNLEINSDNHFRLLKGVIYRLSTGELAIIFDDLTHDFFDQQTLKKNESKFRNIFENCNEGMFLLQEKRIVDCNKKILKMFGLSKKSEIIGLSPIAYSPPKQADGMGSARKYLHYLRRAESTRSQTFYWQYLKKDGAIFDTEVSIKSFYLEEELYLLASIRDVTDTPKHN